MSGVRISNYEYFGELFGGSNFELLACIIFISPVSEFRITFQKNCDRTFLLFQGVDLGDHKAHVVYTYQHSSRVDACTRCAEGCNTGLAFFVNCFCTRNVPFRFVSFRFEYKYIEIRFVSFRTVSFFSVSFRLN